MRGHVQSPEPTLEGFRPLFDGGSLDDWQMAGKGRFTVDQGALKAQPGDDIGLLWCSVPTPPDFVLKLEWKRNAEDDDSGVYLRFPKPDANKYLNPATTAVLLGFEVQIDERGAPDGAPFHKTGAIYSEYGQTLTQQPAKPPGEWNEFEVRAEGQLYTVFLNGTEVAQFRNTNPHRGAPGTERAPSFIGLQAHSGHVAFRNIQIKKI